MERCPVVVRIIPTLQSIQSFIKSSLNFLCTGSHVRWDMTREDCEFRLYTGKSTSVPKLIDYRCHLALNNVAGEGSIVRCTVIDVVVCRNIRWIYCKYSWEHWKLVLAFQLGIYHLNVWQASVTDNGGVIGGMIEFGGDCRFFLIQIKASKITELLRCCEYDFLCVDCVDSGWRVDNDSHMVSSSFLCSGCRPDRTSQENILSKFFKSSVIQLMTSVY
jgi:hypothetical protein